MSDSHALVVLTLEEAEALSDFVGELITIGETLPSEDPMDHWTPEGLALVNAAHVKLTTAFGAALEDAAFGTCFQSGPSATGARAAEDAA